MSPAGGRGQSIDGPQGQTEEAGQAEGDPELWQPQAGQVVPQRGGAEHGQLQVPLLGQDAHLLVRDPRAGGGGRRRVLLRDGRGRSRTGQNHRGRFVARSLKLKNTVL